MRKISRKFTRDNVSEPFFIHFPVSLSLSRGRVVTERENVEQESDIDNEKC